MLFPTDAYELVHAHPLLSGGAAPSANDAGMVYPKVPHFYDAPESDWPKLGTPAIIWVPTDDDFDDNHLEKVVIEYQGKTVTLEPISRCRAGHDVHIFVTRTADLACYRALFSVLRRFMVALRYALNTTANYRIVRGGMDRDRKKYPTMLHYVLRIAPCVPVVEEPNGTAVLDEVVIVRSTSIG